MAAKETVFLSIVKWDDGTKTAFITKSLSQIRAERACKRAIKEEDWTGTIVSIRTEAIAIPDQPDSAIHAYTDLDGYRSPEAEPV